MTLAKLWFWIIVGSSAIVAATFIHPAAGCCTAIAIFAGAQIIRQGADLDK
jgi:divalent metal cation (Fe/Co/Zn/Cd) transporter